MQVSFSDMLNNMDPRVMIEPPHTLAETDVNLGVEHLTKEKTQGAFDDGYYFNTTRIEDNVQYYKYMWKHACAFTTWTPSNQYLHANQNRLK